jgi:hypothetical protein
VLIKTVTFNKPEGTHKMLTGLDQKVGGQGLGVIGPLPQMSRHRSKGTTRTRMIQKMNEVTPLFSRKGK